MLGQFDVLLLLDAAADGDNDLRLREIDGLLGFLEGSSGWLRWTPSAILAFTVSTGAAACAGFSFVATESARLECHEMRRGAGKGDVGGELALEHLPGKDQLVTVSCGNRWRH